MKMRRNCSTSSTRHPRGQALVEFALILPVFVLLIVGIFDFGRVVWATTSVTNAAREAARYAIVHGGSPDNACPVGPPGQETVVPSPSPDCPFPSPSKESIRDAVEHFAIAGGGPIVVAVCYGENCSGDTDTVNADGDPATNERGTPVTVSVTTSVNLSLPGLFGISAVSFDSAHTMLVNH
jgi:hypothetical protein